MTDSELVRVVARIDRLIAEADRLMRDVIIEHPNGEDLQESMYDNGMGHTWACGSIAHPHLLRPEKWELVHGRLRYLKGGDA